MGDEEYIDIDVESDAEEPVAAIVDEDLEDVHIGVDSAIIEAVSPRANVSKSGKTTTITITDIDGTTTADVYDGENDKNYEYEQATPRTVWHVNHGLGKYPSVTVVDSSGNAVIGDIVYIDQNNLTLTFEGAFSGKAYLN